MSALIEVKDLVKVFNLPRERSTTLKQRLINWRGQSYENLKALNGIDFEVKRGEFFGIIGRNGSGKSTLLKILAGIYTPSRGEVEVWGRLTPFIELGVGFNQELTGKDNVYLNGAILGLSKKEIEAKYKEIVDFAELEKFMDQKLKNYSSGMQVRLAFSVAIQAHSDILLIDEVLAVGDSNFQRKCYDHFHKLKKQQKTVVLVTHDMAAIQEFCDRGVVLDQAKIVSQGLPQQIIAKYEALNLKILSSTARTAASGGTKIKNGAIITKLYTQNEKAEKTALFTPKDKQISIKVEFKALDELDQPFVGVAITNLEGRVVFAGDSQLQKVKLGKIRKGERFLTTFTIQNIYTDDTYMISTAVDSRDRKTSYARWDSGHTIRVRGWQLSHSLVHPRYLVDIDKITKTI